MKNIFQPLLLLHLVVFFGLSSCKPEKEDMSGKTEILKWSGGKQSAISLTWDDGSVNQFRIALPMMDSLGLPATFYIITGQIPGSVYKPEFIGRSVDEIIRESAQLPTSQENLFERASVAAYAPYRGLREYHTRAGELFENGKMEEACQEIDKAFEMVRTGKLKTVQRHYDDQSRDNSITWDQIKLIAQRGHEFASHTISHPRLSVLDEKNMLYELEKSKEEIYNKLGPEFTFSAECPYGTENERVMEYALNIYPALRNRMPADYLVELNRGSRETPGSFDNEYIQWQRGPLTATPMDLMKSWVDSCMIKDNVWLVLVFHGVEGIGWESKTSEELSEYFNFLKQNQQKLWIATFRDVTKYMRERMNAGVEVKPIGKTLSVKLTHPLDRTMYNYPLTLKTYVPDSWASVDGTQDGEIINIRKLKDEKGDFVLYEAIPNGGEILLSSD